MVYLRNQLLNLFLTGFTIGFLASITGVIFGLLFSTYIDEIRNALSILFGINIFPSDVYYLEKMPSEINIVSVSSVFSFFSNYRNSVLFSGKMISKMKTGDALKYE